MSSVSANISLWHWLQLQCIGRVHPVSSQWSVKWSDETQAGVHVTGFTVDVAHIYTRSSKSSFAWTLSLQSSHVEHANSKSNILGNITLDMHVSNMYLLCDKEKRKQCTYLIDTTEGLHLWRKAAWINSVAPQLGDVDEKAELCELRSKGRLPPPNDLTKLLDNTLPSQQYAARQIFFNLGCSALLSLRGSHPGMCHLWSNRIQLFGPSDRLALAAPQ